MIGEELLINVYYFSLILARSIGLLLIVPIFGSKVLPARLKVSIAIIIAILLLPVINTGGIEVPERLLIISFQIITELFIGFILGFILLLTFIAIQLAGQFLDRRMGFAMASVMDPQNGMKAPLLGQFKNILAILLFLSFDGHHYILKLLADSFDIVTITEFEASDKLIELLLRSIGDLFPLAFKIALPIISILFIIDLAFGLVARTVPQLNVFIVGLPTKIFVGLIFLFLILPVYANFIHDRFLRDFDKLYDLLKLMVKKG